MGYIGIDGYTHPFNVQPQGSMSNGFCFKLVSIHYATPAVKAVKEKSMFSNLLSPHPFVFFNKDESAGGADPSADQDEDPAPTGGDDKKDKTLTQEQVNKLLADTRKQARSSVLKKAGYETEEELLKAIAEGKKLSDEKLTEKQRIEKEAADAKSEKDRLSKENAELRFERDFDKALRVLSYEFQNEKARDVAIKMIDTETAGKGEKEMQEALKTLREEHSYLFLSDEDVDIDATTKGKTKLRTSKREVIENKRRSGSYQPI